MSVNRNYWDSFYKGDNRKLSLPSQFAVFIANEFLEKINTVFDIGCGNGRDSLFFDSIGLRVIGIDASTTSISKLQNLQTSARFVASDISSNQLSSSLSDLVNSQDSVLFYSRFFLHAISDQEEKYFWEFVSSFKATNTYVAVEFRTHRDELLSKSTANHFRRFLRPSDLLERALMHGFKCSYFTEGFGYAKYNDDDAHVARILLSK